MEATRKARLESLILEELSRLISRELKDPRVPPLTLSSVKLTQDAKQATILVLILGEQSPNRDQMKNCLEGLMSAAGFLRRHLAKALTVKHIPSLVFKEDRGLENTIRVEELLKKISEGRDAP